MDNNASEKESPQLPRLEVLQPFVQNPTGSCLLVAFLRGQHFIHCLNNWTKPILRQSTAHTQPGGHLQGMSEKRSRGCKTSLNSLKFNMCKRKVLHVAQPQVPAEARNVSLPSSLACNLSAGRQGALTANYAEQLQSEHYREVGEVFIPLYVVLWRLPWSPTLSVWICHSGASPAKATREPVKP